MGTKIFPDLKGTDRVREDCGRCFGTGYVDFGRVTFTVDLVDAAGKKVGQRGGRLCFDCLGAGTVSVLVSSVRAREARRVKAQAEQEARAEAYAARAAAEAAESAELEAAAAAALEAARAATRHLGAVGEKIEVQVTLSKQFAFDGDYGPSYLWIWESVEGDAVTCYSSAQPLFDFRDNAPEGAVITIAATVKAHTEYNGIKQTQIVRPRIVG